MERLDQHVIEMASLLAQELKHELASLNSPTTGRAGGESAAPPSIMIDKVAELTRNVDKQEYEPHFVSIGPYNRSCDCRSKLARDSDKVGRLQEVLSAAAAHTTAPLQLEDFITELARMEARARRCYKLSFDHVQSKDFLRWLLLDGCYILVRFGDVVMRRRPEDEEVEEEEETTADGIVLRVSRWFHVASYTGLLRRRLLDACYVLVRLRDVVVRRRSKVPVAAEANRVVPSMEEREESAVDQQEAVAVVRDVFYLAENQIPFFVVDKIHQLTFLDGQTPAVHAIARYARELLRVNGYSVATPTKVEEPERPPEPANLLHLLHMHFTPTVLASAASTGSRRRGGGRPVGRWRTAMEYYFAGVTFKKRPLDDQRGGARCVLDVKVSGWGGGTLEMPQLTVDAETWPLLRNLMALEQSNPAAAGSHVTAYCVFMSQLACTAADVELLSRRGVIVHGLGHNGEVAKHFADLCKGAVFDADDADMNYLRPVCQVLERRFQSRPRRWMAWLKKKYFANPWLIAGLVAATVGLVCTVIQAVYSVLGYTKPGS
ncbi:uncharacterized protein LOC127782570 [Oryza glaberrima]|uniref:Uncharacterized protein n=1 Tax=Oryza glaberrima TaxID=4538 RepID=I1QI08_ORYGL|nr:uncharacterized protein LOC127782570 [Oryza glaberrima]